MCQAVFKSSVSTEFDGSTEQTSEILKKIEANIQWKQVEKLIQQTFDNDKTINSIKISIQCDIERITYENDE